MSAMRRGAPAGGLVVRHVTIRKLCPKHGEQDHMSVFGYRCVECHKEGLIEQGLVKP
jgi:hypothetical protein